MEKDNFGCKKGSPFLTDFNKCIFESSRSKLVTNFNLNENNLVKSMYAIK